jgi:hypothetical protein
VERSFFGALQSWFKEGYGSDYGGRYVGLLLEHGFRVDPRPLKAFFRDVSNLDLSSKHITLEREHLFRGRNGSRRRADLAVLADGRVSALVELKYRDRLLDGGGPKPAQLDDYLHYCRRNACNFLLLHREPQTTRDIKKIKNAKQCLAHYAQLASYLARSAHSSSQLLYQYFQEGGLVLEPIHTDYLARFMHRLVLPSNRGGRVNITSKITEGPRQFQALLNNMRLFAADVTPQLLRVTRKESARAATVDFEIRERFDRDDVRAQTQQTSKGGYLWIDSSCRRGGSLEIWANNAFTKDHQRWLYVFYGFEFHLEKAQKLGIDQFAYVSSPEIDRAWKKQGDDRFVTYATFGARRLANPSKAHIDSDFIELIKDAAKKALRTGIVKERTARRTLVSLSKL